MLTVVTPAYNETRNLPLLYEQLKKVLDDPALGIEWEWIVVDDHSKDGTFELMAGIAAQDPRVRSARFSRNFGSHAAITYGLNHARGDCAVTMAADLQDPPDLIPTLLAEWKKGAHIVWASRSNREGESFSTLLFARLYYDLTSKIEGLKNRPRTGVDFCLLDRCVIDAFAQMHESHVSIISLIAWMGFRQTTVLYNKQARRFGKSHVNFEKKLLLALDTITAFTYAPIRMMSYAGFVIAFLGFCYAAFIILRALVGSPPEGWASLIVTVLVMGGIQMVMMGILGEYLWRTLDEVRSRPRYIIESATDKPGSWSSVNQPVTASAANAPASGQETLT